MRFDRLASWLVACVAAALVLLIAGSARAYPDYAAGCNACHGTFNSGTYSSLKDGSSWNNDLMHGHLSNIIGGSGSARCDVCHSGNSKAPVPLNVSNGAGSLAQLGCMGCHGRAADNTSADPDWSNSRTTYGAGLRQHHFTKGVKICSGCHADADPASYTPVGEDTMPPYYGDTTFPLIPTDPCNPNSSEDRIASALGLDNDGDGVFDMSDSDCSSCTPTTCAAQGKDCGTISNSCGGTLSCGSCTAPETCGGGGSANVCGCTPTTCAAQGKDCGSISDGCGSTLNCGSCTASQTCVAGVCIAPDAGADAEAGAQDAAETDAFADAQQDAPVEAASEATASDATTSDATTSDADLDDGATNDGAFAEAGTDAGANEAGSASAGAGESGGCGCRLATGNSSPANTWWLLALGGVLLLRRGRRNRRA